MNKISQGKGRITLILLWPAVKYCLVNCEDLGNVGIFEYDKNYKCWGNVLNDSLALSILKREMPALHKEGGAI